MGGPARIVIGRKEYVRFLGWPTPRVRAKIDTGAYTSTLDVLEYRLLPDPDAPTMVSLRLAPQRGRPDRVAEAQAPFVRLARVRDSSGRQELRPVIAVTLQLGPFAGRVEVTLTRRPLMRYPMLLGRRALAGTFVVDVSRAYLWTPGATPDTTGET